MADDNFLAHFIEEPIYVIASEELSSPESKEIEVEAAPVTPATLTEDMSSNEPEVTSNVVEEPEAPVYVTPLPTIGDNLKHCIVLVDSENELLEEPLKVLLYKIMGAVKRNAEDILIANCRNAKSDQIEALLANNNHRHLLAFGTDVLVQMKENSLYEIKKEGAVSMLKSDPLVEIQQNVDKKKALWKALQEMFL